MRIAVDRIIAEIDTITIFAVQVGVTRCGAGGWVQPRTRRGAWASVLGLVASTVEPQELESRPTPVRRPAPLARAVAMLAVAVVALAERTAFETWAAIWRVLRCVWWGRPGRIYHRRMTWAAVWRGDEMWA